MNSQMDAQQRPSGTWTVGGGGRPGHFPGGRARERASGFGIKDGRGYGPYKTGYYAADDGCDCPLGPRGEKLSSDYDYQCGAGGYLTALRPPRKLLPGYRASDVMPKSKEKSMNGFECLGADDVDYVGFDYMSLLSGAGGALSGLSGGGGAKGGDVAAMQQMMAQQKIAAAEKSASTMKWLLAGLAVVVGIGGTVLLVRR